MTELIRGKSAFIRTLAVWQCRKASKSLFAGARLLKRTKDTLLFCPLGGYLEKAGKSSLKICCWNFSKRGKERACERQQNGPRLPHLVHVRGRNRPTVLRLWAQHAETELEQPQTGKEDGGLPWPKQGINTSGVKPSDFLILFGCLFSPSTGRPTSWVVFLSWSLFSLSLSLKKRGREERGERGGRSKWAHQLAPARTDKNSLCPGSSFRSPATQLPTPQPG